MDVTKTLTEKRFVDIKPKINKNLLNAIPFEFMTTGMNDSLTGSTLVRFGYVYSLKKSSLMLFHYLWVIRMLCVKPVPEVGKPFHL